jgi:GNAT superfamily N-acetyltransferase
MSVTFVELNASSWDSFEELLRPSNGCDGCWCYNHHIKPGNPDVTGEAARKAFKHLVTEKKAHGILLFEDSEPAGWCAVDKKAQICGHDCADPLADPKNSTVWAVHCFYLREKSRGKGFTQMLLQKAQELVLQYGGLILEAYPTPPNDSGQIFDFCGPYKIFARQGFTESERVHPGYCRLVKSLS